MTASCCPERVTRCGAGAFDSSPPLQDTSVDLLGQRRPYQGEGLVSRLLMLMLSNPVRYLAPQLPAWF